MTRSEGQAPAAMRDNGAAPEESLLADVSPIVKLGIALAWLLGLATTTRLEPPLLLAIVALAAVIVVGGGEAPRVARRLAPILLIPPARAPAHFIFARSNFDPAPGGPVRIGPAPVSGRAPR